MEAGISDEQLIKKYLSGDEESLRALIRRYLKPVHHFVFRYVGNAADAEDVVQDAFVSAWKNLKTFDQTKSFKTWIFAIAKNTSLNWIKKKKPQLFSEFENERGENSLVDSFVDPSPLPDELFARADLGQELSLAMDKLHRRHRMVLFLRYNDHLTFREIAESLGEPLHTVKSRHRRGLITLKKILLS